MTYKLIEENLEEFQYVDDDSNDDKLKLNILRIMFEEFFEGTIYNIYSL